MHYLVQQFFGRKRLMKGKRYALVMGASGDIGSSCVKELAKEGWSIYCHYYQNESKMRDIVQSLMTMYPHQEFFMVQYDMTDTKHLDQFLSSIYALELIVFAMGHTEYALLTDLEEEHIDRLWQVHLKTPILLCQQLQNKLSVSKSGRIIFIGSVYGSYGSAMEVVYSTVKGGQESFVKAYAKEVASLGITVNLIAPGAVHTQMNHLLTTEDYHLLTQEIPLNKLATPLDIAYGVLFLSSKQAEYITGITLPIDGGWKG